jgi:aldose 1-epimerase
MYAALLMRRFAQVRHNLWQTAIKRSGLFITIAATIVLLLVALALKERGHGHLSKLKTELGHGAAPHTPPPVRPGDQDTIVLSRTQTTEMDTPQFLSATLLPGRGMNVLQIQAYVPRMGEISLLASPPLEEAATQLSGTGEDVDGSASLTMGGAIEVPWASRIWGSASVDSASLTTNWRGHSLSLPADWEGDHSARSAASVGGLLLKQQADTVKSTVMPDGGQAQAIYNAADFNGRWVSHTKITTTVQLNGRALEMSISAQNTGDQVEPIGIGWHPRFAIPGKDRADLLLKLPNALHAEVADRRSGMPSGKLLPVEGTPYDFTGRNGARLGEMSLDDTFVHLKQGLLDSGPVAELRDLKSNYGLRITALSPTIKAIRVDAPSDGSFVSIDPQFNYDDPFGKEWAKGEDTGMVVLQPGQTVQWKVRLEIFSLTGSAAGPM